MCTVRASQAGNATYGAAKPVSRSFIVTKPALGPALLEMEHVL
jgi:hypothetical protein